MNRRILGPVGGPIAFFLVAGFVFAVLGWVTHAALRVEEAQREAAMRADREKDLRIALRQLDGRILPALSVEDIRPFHEYKNYSPDDAITIYGPACAPLLAADLPDWMQLHFQVDPEGSWDSPQVLNSGTRLSLGQNWKGLPLRNATKSREELLTMLGTKFPARQVSDTFAVRERAIPAISSASLPVSQNTPDFSDTTIPSNAGERKEPAPEKLDAPPKPGVPPTAPVVLPPAPAKVDSDAEVRKNDDKAGDKAGATAQANSAFARKSTENQALRNAAPEPRPLDEAAKAVDGKATAGRSIEQKQSQSDYDRREVTSENARRDAQRAGNNGIPYYLTPPNLGQGQNLQQQNKNLSAVPAMPAAPAAKAVPTSGPVASSAALSGGTGGGAGSKPSLGEGAPGDDRFFKAAKETDSFDKNRDKKSKADEKAAGFDNMAKAPVPKFSATPAYKPVEGSLYRMMEEEKLKDLERQQGVHRGDLKKDNGDKRSETKDIAKGNDGSNAMLAKGVSGPSSVPAAPGAVPPGFGAPPRGGPLPAPATPAGPPAPGGLGGSPGGGGATPAKKPIAPTPNPMPPAELEPVEKPAPMIPPAIPMPDEGPTPPQPVAVHLGSMRPQWITAPDGTEVLVVVRAARVENKKTIYQGVVLDWSKLQAALKDEVKDLFPEAKLVPVKELNDASRDQSMTALPVHLDPGPSPEPPPAGWTPLRIGLVLAWIAAAIAFTAVGLSGWSLIDLAERRIRFVSAVTHELRTPLTSLRLYLDLLLSGMVQDEEKRREYLSTLNVESDRLHRLIDNVLDYARLERRRKGRTLQAMNAADLLDQVRRTWTDRVAADGKELVVISTLPPELEVMTDSSLVQQIVGNLIDNARKYTREATDTRIWLWARIETSNRVVFEVEDRGPGVLPREQKVIFRPFRRGETADAKAGGAGLGLALSREWAEVLGGKLTYRGAEGGIGSCFRLELPIK